MRRCTTLSSIPARATPSPALRPMPMLSNRQSRGSSTGSVLRASKPAVPTANATKRIRHPSRGRSQARRPSKVDPPARGPRTSTTAPTAPFERVLGCDTDVGLANGTCAYSWTALLLAVGGRHMVMEPA
eukprot:scaffold271437_cov27-Tisochrysis_lutea.AAC.3